MPALTYGLAEVPPQLSADNTVAGELERALWSLASVSGEKPVHLDPLLAFYQKRGYRPVWCDAGGVYSPAARDWLSILGRAEGEGMTGLLMHREAIRQRLDAEGPVELAELDLMLTDSFFQYARKMGQGQLDSALVDPDWHIPQPEIKPAALLERLVRSGRFAEAAGALLPRHPEYRALRQALARYTAIQESGGWPLLQRSGRRLEPGDTSLDIKTLRQQLWLLGDLAEDAAQGYVYDAELERAVVRFQRRHGLRGDGIVGAQTRAALAVPVAQRIDQIRLNLERWRWLPRELGSRYITVNTAAFELRVHDQDAVPLSMRVIVGKTAHPTPVFSEKMRYLIVNPYWHVPSRVAIRDLIPKQLRQPDFFRSRAIRVLSGWQPDAAEVDPQQVDWRRFLDSEHLPYKLIQDPGPGNALGRIKFMLPNIHSIYLHDTPAKHLFEKPVRAFSAGCIRVEKPLALARYVLGLERSAAPSMLEALVEQPDTRTIVLQEPIPVYVWYQTAWVDGAGTLQFRDDIYGHDERLAAALHRELAPQRGGRYVGDLTVQLPDAFSHR
jgi:murein L,D-transpeptidase YcbB/YkuD